MQPGMIPGIERPPIAASISYGRYLTPLILRLSFTRPIKLSWPPASIMARSPVLNQPSCVNASAVADGLLKYPWKTTGPVNSRLPDSLGAAVLGSPSLVDTLIRSSIPGMQVPRDANSYPFSKSYSGNRQLKIAPAQVSVIPKPGTITFLGAPYLPSSFESAAHVSTTLASPPVAKNCRQLKSSRLIL